MKTNLKLLKFSFVICFLAIIPIYSSNADNTLTNCQIRSGRSQVSDPTMRTRCEMMLNERIIQVCQNSSEVALGNYNRCRQEYRDTGAYTGPRVAPTASTSTQSIPRWTASSCGRARSVDAQSQCARDLATQKQNDVCRAYDNPERTACESSIYNTGSYSPPGGTIPPWTASQCGRYRTEAEQTRCATNLTNQKQNEQCKNLSGQQKAGCEANVAKTGTPNAEPTDTSTPPPGKGRDPEQPVAAEDAECQPSENGQPRICFKNPFPEAQAVGNHAALSGTDAFVDCNAQSAQSWGQVTTDRNQNTSQIWSAAWSQLGKKTAQEVNGIADAAQAAQKLDQAVKEAKDMYAKLMSCEAYRSLTAGGSFSSQQGGDRRQGSAKKEKKSADGQITCKSCGEETQDFEPCVKAANAYDAALVGQAAFSGYQQISNMDKTLDAQSNLDPNNPTSGISAQADVLRNQGNLATQQAAVDAGKTGLFFSMWSAMPDAETVEKRCVDDAMRGRLRANDLAQDLEKFVAEARRAAAQAQQQLRNADTSQIASTARREIQQACRKTLAGSCVINNAEAKDKMKQAAIMAGIEAFVNMGKAALLARQANRLDKLVDEVEAFDPTDLNYNPEDYFGSECELNPMAEGCDNFVSERSFGFGDGGPIQIHGLTQATTFDRGNGDLNGGDDNAVIPSNASREDIPRPVGAFDPGSKGPTGFVGNTPGAAGIEEGGGNLGGGGGGGGGVGSAGAPPGGPGGGAGAGAPQMAKPTGATANAYDGGTGSIRLGGGYGAQGSRGPDAGAENPFGDLFGGKNPQGGALDFRDPASEGDIASKDASIFSIITNRYGIVQQSDRLLEYERD